MADTTSRVKRIASTGLALLIVGTVLFGTAVVGSASPGAGSAGCQNSACSLNVSPDNPFAPDAPAQVTGKHFAAKAWGAVFECNMDPNAPVIAVPDHKGSLGPVSVGCSFYGSTATRVSRRGTFFVGMTVATGVVGPPVAGTDSTGGSAETDAATYPCPPTEAQIDAGVSCALVFQDAKKHTRESAYADISFTTAYSTTTTTTTSTTDPSCPQVPVAAAAGGATITLTPGTCLVAGTVVTVTGTGLNPADLGSIMECNTAAGEPTAWNTVAGQAIPVGCTDPIDDLVTTTTTGTLVSASGSKPATVTIVTGTTGPPFSAANGDEGTPPADTPPADLPTDSNAQAMIDAPAYPCPPTAAQVSAGVSCAIVFGDQAPRGESSNQFVVPITFDTSGLEGTPGS